MGRRTRSGCMSLSSRLRALPGSRLTDSEMSGLKLKPTRGGAFCDWAQVSLPSRHAKPTRATRPFTSLQQRQHESLGIHLEEAEYRVRQFVLNSRLGAA